ncbi:hypothetical protein BD309DRAFT_867975 [Dichomitus squalens]|nr:hypothetical protein BD309DRAFT_867975 [Dichomitus squalens]
MSIPDAAGIIAIRDAGYTATLMTAGVGAWVGYDYLLTVGRESRLFWRRKVNAASILFYTNRYLALFYYVALAYYRIIPFPFPYDVDIGIRYMEYLPWAVFSALRVYALSHKNWALSVFTFFCSVIALPLNYYATTPSFLSLIVVIRGGQIIADAIVIGVTWKATYQARSERSMSYLMTVMFKNGKCTVRLARL